MYSFLEYLDWYMTGKYWNYLNYCRALWLFKNQQQYCYWDKSITWFSYWKCILNILPIKRKYTFCVIQMVFRFLFNDRKTHNIQHRPIRIIHLSDSQGNRTRLMIKRVSFRLSPILIWILSAYAWGTFPDDKKREK